MPVRLRVQTLYLPIQMMGGVRGGKGDEGWMTASDGCWVMGNDGRQRSVSCHSCASKGAPRRRHRSRRNGEEEKKKEEGRREGSLARSPARSSMQVGPPFAFPFPSPPPPVPRHTLTPSHTLTHRSVFVWFQVDGGKQEPHTARPPCKPPSRGGASDGPCTQSGVRFVDGSDGMEAPTGISGQCAKAGVRALQGHQGHLRTKAPLGADPVEWGTHPQTPTWDLCGVGGEGPVGEWASGEVGGVWVFLGPGWLSWNNRFAAPARGETGAQSNPKAHHHQILSLRHRAGLGFQIPGIRPPRVSQTVLTARARGCQAGRTGLSPACAGRTAPRGLSLLM